MSLLQGRHDGVLGCGCGVHLSNQRTAPRGEAAKQTSRKLGLVQVMERLPSCRGASVPRTLRHQRFVCHLLGLLLHLVLTQAGGHLRVTCQ